MQKKDYIILREFATSVRKKYPEAEIIAFGSRVTGNASEFSDFDVCIVLQFLDENIDKDIINIAWEIGFKNDIVISTVTFSKNDFENGAISFSPFVKSIQQSGVAA